MSEPHVIAREQWVPCTLPDMFAFFSDANNLELLTPPWLNFQILTPGPIHIAAGTLIDYRLRWHGIPMRWKTEITQWEPPFMFVDNQLSGPYALWHHTHTFQAERGGTRMHDVVRYSVPFGPLGRLAHSISVRKNVQDIFDYRYRQVEARFGLG